jgi:GH25 family lysozyme M1 (1,4-beta-N-acetylmuramidase)
VRFIKKLVGLSAVATVAVTVFAATSADAAPAGLPGMDVSSYQGNVNWSSAWSHGARWAYVKATEGTGYTNPYFAQQYNGSYNIGMIRGAYHFARPNLSSGVTQANYFVDHGGGWSKDGKTLPGAVDLENYPGGANCYGMSQSTMRTWIGSFVNQYHSRTTRWPAIYVTASWWSSCVGSYNPWAASAPLWVARWASSVGTLPYGWSFYSFWQWDDAGTFPGDQDVWNGTLARLKVMACNGTC